MDLPNDLVVDILARLPVKCLMKLRCVCKYWRGLIRSPDFIDVHSKHPKNQDKDVILLNLFIGGSPNDEPVFIEGCRLDDSSYTVFNSILTTTMDHSARLPLISHHILILTHQYQILPQFLIVAMALFVWHVCRFCLRSTDQLLNTSICGIRLLVRQRVFLLAPLSFPEDTLSILGRWDLGRVTASVTPHTGDTDGIFFHGSYHWCAENQFSEPIIAFFDMSLEVVQEMKYPDPKHVGSHVTVLAGFLAMIVSSSRCVQNGDMDWQDINHITIWVRTEYGSDSSWMKKCTIGPLEGYFSTMVCWKEDNLLIRRNNLRDNGSGRNNEEVTSCDAKSDIPRVKRYGIIGEHMRAVIYKESLASMHLI
ncbi:OLC1v1014434C1 [Oldenlandia corymbosa var. corymbosa]|uniref:OLC1v1014434C1 n=1 Tax=Oldenlandia corymbosa var. corymbosa TaxID=529605 RepID=A0AAV1E0U8_OLDCO|nr:OLC1v1014434C1 [Oldenlandia corymbosa var. corymbosa]